LVWRFYGACTARGARRARSCACPSGAYLGYDVFETGGLRPAFCRRARWARGGGGAGRAYVVSSPGLRELELTVLATVGEPWSLNLNLTDRQFALGLPVRALKKLYTVLKS